MSVITNVGFAGVSMKTSLSSGVCATALASAAWSPAGTGTARMPSGSRN
jgi:hypothetical protein